MEEKKQSILSDVVHDKEHNQPMNKKTVTGAVVYSILCLTVPLVLVYLWGDPVLKETGIAKWHLVMIIAGLLGLSTGSIHSLASLSAHSAKGDLKNSLRVLSF